MDRKQESKRTGCRKKKKDEPSSRRGLGGENSSGWTLINEKETEETGPRGCKTYGIEKVVISSAGPGTDDDAVCETPPGRPFLRPASYSNTTFRFSFKQVYAGRTRPENCATRPAGPEPVD